MLGVPEDIPGNCNARLSIADDYGDNSATMLCRLGPGHAGPHEEVFNHNGGKVTIIWEDKASDENEALPIGG